MDTLSPQALSLFRLHVERRGEVEVNDSNREPYRELEAAGLVLLSRPFVGPRVYRLTREGFVRRQELLAATSPSLSESA